MPDQLHSHWLQGMGGGVISLAEVGAGVCCWMVRGMRPPVPSLSVVLRCCAFALRLTALL